MSVRPALVLLALFVWLVAFPFFAQTTSALEEEPNHVASSSASTVTGYTVAGHVAEFPPCFGSQRGIGVALNPGGYTAQTDLINGNFVLNNIPDGNYTVSIPSMCNIYGCWQSVQISVSGADVTGVNVCMNSSATSTPTRTPTQTPTNTPSATPTFTDTQTPTFTPTSMPGANFVGSLLSGNAPLTVQFNHIDSSLLSTCTWSFGDGTTQTFTAPTGQPFTQCPSASHIYTGQGLYSVTLSVRKFTNGNTNSFTRYDYVEVFEALTQTPTNTPSTTPTFTVTPIQTSTPTQAQSTDLGGMVWVETTLNGLRDESNAGMSNIAVSLFNTNSQVISSTVTDSTGHYLFPNLPASTYVMGFTSPQGYTFTIQDALGNLIDGYDSDAYPSTGLTSQITITSSNLSIDAGLLRLPFNLSGQVWQEFTKNGLRDETGAGIAGVQISVLDANSVVISSTLTDSNGQYLFPGLPAATYTVKFMRPNGFTFAIKDALGNMIDAYDSDADPMTGLTDLIILTSNKTTIDAGFNKFPYQKFLPSTMREYNADW